MRLLVAAALLCLMPAAVLQADDASQPTFYDAISVTDETPLLIPVDFDQAVEVDFRIGELDLGVGIGDAWVQGDDVDVESKRRKFLGARARWESGGGDARIAAKLGIGDVGVVLE